MKAESSEFYVILTTEQHIVSRQAELTYDSVTLTWDEYTNTACENSSSHTALTDEVSRNQTTGRWVCTM